MGVYGSSLCCVVWPQVVEDQLAAYLRHEEQQQHAHVLAALLAELAADAAKAQLLACVLAALQLPIATEASAAAAALGEAEAQQAIAQAAVADMSAAGHSYCGSYECYELPAAHGFFASRRWAGYGQQPQPPEPESLPPWMSYGPLPAAELGSPLPAPLPACAAAGRQGPAVGWISCGA